MSGSSTIPARRAGGPPRRRPAATPVALLVAVLLVGIAVVAVHDLAVAQDWASGTAWLTEAVRSLDGLTASVGLVVAGAAVALVGLLLVVAAFAPARRTHQRADVAGDLWFSPGAVAALGHELADRAPGVLSAEVGRTSRRRVVIEVAGRSGADDTEPARVAQAAQEALDAELRDLVPTRVVVRARKVTS